MNLNWVKLPKVQSYKERHQVKLLKGLLTIDAFLGYDDVWLLKINGQTIETTKQPVSFICVDAFTWYYLAGFCDDLKAEINMANCDCNT